MIYGSIEVSQLKSDWDMDPVKYIYKMIVNNS